MMSHEINATRTFLLDNHLKDTHKKKMLVPHWLEKKVLGLKCLICALLRSFQHFGIFSLHEALNAAVRHGCTCIWF